MNVTATTRSKRNRSLIGRVLNSQRDKTITVLVERKVKHSAYGKYVTRSKKYHAHDETNACQEGDFVEIQETRPISKTKSWTFSRLVQKTAVRHVEHTEINS